MEVIRGGDECPRPAQGSALTIGAFDGVHRGHLAVIGEVRRLAAAQGLGTAVVTFDRHPAMVVRPESAPKLLTDLEQKLELLAATRIDYTLVIDFDEARSKETAEEFVRDVLTGCLNAKVVAVGDDFHFGHERRGNVALLRSMGAELGFDVAPLALVGADGRPAPEAERVSSTAIRRALAAGEVDRAHELLGRPHEVRGTVIEGDRRGRTWGFPTANVSVPDETCLPADGVYAGWYERPTGERHPAAISLGRRPTIYDEQPYSLLEAHLLDFDGDLYGEPARVQFVAWLHGDVRFDSTDELVAQISRDCDATRRVLRST